MFNFDETLLGEFVSSSSSSTCTSCKKLHSVIPNFVQGKQGSVQGYGEATFSVPDFIPSVDDMRGKNHLFHTGSVGAFPFSPFPRPIIWLLGLLLHLQLDHSSSFIRAFFPRCPWLRDTSKRAKDRRRQPAISHQRVDGGKTKKNPRFFPSSFLSPFALC